jgi:hypothetical protein
MANFHPLHPRVTGTRRLDRQSTNLPLARQISI